MSTVLRSSAALLSLVLAAPLLAPLRPASAQERVVAAGVLSSTPPAAVALPPAPIAPAAPAVAAPPRPVPAKGARAKPEGQPEILLTFDDGPRPELTSQVLEMLEARGLKAVFFVMGQRFQGKGRDAERGRELMREMVRRGHLVGNHTVHHFFLCGKRGPKIAAQEIEQNAEMIEQVIGMRPLLYRTPYGAHCKTLSATLQQLGVKHIGWDIDPQDWKLRDTPKILAFMQGSLKRLKGRAIVLFHDVQPATVAALPQLLTWIDQENAARRLANQAEIKIIDYRFLLSNQPALPPMIDSIARVLLDTIRAWPAPLAFLPPLPSFLSAPGSVPAAPSAPPPSAAAAPSSVPL